MPISQANGAAIHYEVSGEGPAMILLHPIPFDHSLWLYQAARFSAWFRIVAPDLRGWGRSAKVAEPFTMMDMARDILGVMDDLGEETAIVMGCSIGSKLALLLGAHWPERFRAVIQVGGNSGPQDMRRRIEGYRDAPFAAYRRDHLRFGLGESFADTEIGRYLTAMFSERDGWHDRAAIGRVFEALSEGDVREALATYPLPTLILNGEHDNALAAGRATAAAIPGARHVVLKDAGHCCMVAAPEAFDAAVIAFLDAHGLMPERPAMR